MENPRECIIEVFDRFNKLIIDLQLHGKYYETHYKNLKFLRTFLDHLEQKISATREGRDQVKMSLQVHYVVLKTFELDMIQRKFVKAGQGQTVELSKTLVS